MPLENQPPIERLSLLQVSSTPTLPAGRCQLAVHRALFGGPGSVQQRLAYVAILGCGHGLMMEDALHFRQVGLRVGMWVLVQAHRTASLQR